MGIILYNSVSYLVELFKIIFLCELTIPNEIKRKNNYFLITISSVIVAAIAAFWDMSKVSIIYGLISLIVIFINIKEKKKIIYVIFLEICICLIDMFIAAVFMFVTNITTNKLEEMNYIKIVINSILLIILFLAVFLKRWNHKEAGKLENSYKYLLLYIIGGVSIAICITAIELLGFSKTQSLTIKIGVISFAAGGFIFILICFLLLENRNRSEFLKKEVEINQRSMQIQKEAYLKVLENEENTRKFRHDMRYHFISMKFLLDNDEFDELKKYFNSLYDMFEYVKPNSITGNKLIDIIINNLKTNYKDVVFQEKGKMPNELKIEMVDICTIFSNLLRNAFEASDLTKTKLVDMDVKISGTNLLIVIENDFSKEPNVEGNKFRTNKNSIYHGYGLTNAKEAINKYKGAFEISYSKKKFRVEVMLFSVILA